MRNLFVGIISCAAVAAMAGTPQYNYQRTIDYALHPTVYRMAGVTADPSGGVYFTDNALDNIYYIPDVWTASGATNDPDDVPLVADAATGISFGSGFSYQGMTWDAGANCAVTGGQTNGTSGISSYLKVIPDNVAAPTAWTFERRDIFGSYGGPASVGTNLLALPDRTNGSISIYEWTSSDLVLVAGPFAGSGVIGKVAAYDANSNRIYVSSSGAGTMGRVDYFTYDAVTKTAVYVGVFVEGQSTSYGDTNNGVYYQQIALDPEEDVLAVGRTTGAAATGGHALYNTDVTAIPPVTPYQVITLVPPLANPTANSKLGMAFGSKNGDKFLIVNDGGNKAYVYSQTPTNVEDWAIY